MKKALKKTGQIRAFFYPMVTCIIFLLIVAGHRITARAETYYVGYETDVNPVTGKRFAVYPLDFTTIQEAIDSDSVKDGDTVIVTYNIDENTGEVGYLYKGEGNKNIDFKGKAITLISESGAVVIDCEQDGRGFHFHSGEDTLSVVNGFTIMNGKAADGGGIYCSGSSPTIQNCEIINNSAIGGFIQFIQLPGRGGGICCISSSSPNIINCTIENNSAKGYGGGVYCSNSSPNLVNCSIGDNSTTIFLGLFVPNNGQGAGIYCTSFASPKIEKCALTHNSAASSGGAIYCNSSSSPDITNCIIINNSASSWGGGIYCKSSSPIIINCTISKNTANNSGGGIYCDSSSPIIANCILWGDLPQEISEIDSTPSITYSDIQGGYAGEGNIEANPLFKDPSIGDYHLEFGSPCIDKGTDSSEPISDMDGVARPQDGNEDSEAVYDMGAYEYVGAKIYIYVPDNYSTIQEAIDTAIDGDTVVVRNGIYTGEGNRDLDFKGKSITLRSQYGPEETIIDCEQSGRGFIFQSNETASSVIDGFTVTNGETNDPGDGIYCYYSSPIITNCIIRNNSGEGIYCFNSSPTITKCIISGNSIHGIKCVSSNPIITNCNISENLQSGVYCDNKSSASIIGCTIFKNKDLNNGGGIYCNNSSPVIINCFIAYNSTIGSGGGIYCYYSYPTITNCIISKNTAYKSGGGICCTNSSNDINVINCTISGNMSYENGGGIYCDEASLKVINSILWGNTAVKSQHEIYGSIDISYSNIQQDVDVWPGIGNINEDPLFVKSEQGNYYLQEASPCIDKGTSDNAPSEDQVKIPRPQGDGIDMGAYEYVESSSCIPRASFIVNKTRGIAPVEIEFKASSSVGFEYEDEASFYWDFGDNETSEEQNPSHTYYDCGYHDVSLTVTTPCGKHVLKLYYFIKVKASQPTREVRMEGSGSAYASIQEAIDDADYGEIILVYPGNYYEDINFKGKEVTVKGQEYFHCMHSSTGPPGCSRFLPVIQGASTGSSVVTFSHFEGSNSVLDGFEIRGGVALNGGGIYCFYSSPVIINCDISENLAVPFFTSPGSGNGGGISCNHSSPHIANCLIENNSAEKSGGGIYCYYSSPKIMGCTITKNSAQSIGGGIYCLHSSPIITNCDIITNEASGDGGGIYCLDSDSPIINGCTINENSANKGVGIYCKSSYAIITSCTISKNTTSNYGNFNEYGCGIYCDSASPEITNCIIRENGYADPMLYQYHGGGIYCYSSSPMITNCTFWKNSEWGDYAGQYGIFCASSSSPIIRNCILWDPPSSEIITNSIKSSPQVSYSNIWRLNDEDIYPGIGNINEDPLFADTENGNFQLKFASPCIDKGIHIGDLYSDFRGSLRPLGENRFSSKFDMGACEYSWYWGGEPDAVIKAFTDIKLLAPYAIISDEENEYEYEINWKGMGPFPDNDLRITQPRKYKVNISLISQLGRRIDLIKDGEFSTDISAMTQEGDYLWLQRIKFTDIHEGEWNIRIEMTNDPRQFALSKDTINIVKPGSEDWTVGEPIIPPEGSDITKKPEFDDEVFLWSDITNSLYPIKAPIFGTTVTWKDNKDNSIIVPGNTLWPEDPQIHIKNTPPVELLPEGSKFQSVELLYTQTDIVSIQEGNLFLFSPNTRGGYSVLVYYELNKQKSAPNFEVIKSVDYDDGGSITLTKGIDYEEKMRIFEEESSLYIGQEITPIATLTSYTLQNLQKTKIYGDAVHNCDCGQGYVYFEKARYDAELYNRDAREGQIFAVNKDIGGDKLVVIWYQKSRHNTDVCWPYKSVYYNCDWSPDIQYIDENTIIIASRTRNSVQLPESAEEPKIYIQPDPILPGYNPNEEHGFLIADRVFALRNDLNNIKVIKNASGSYEVHKYPDDPEVVKYTSDPYVLCKYQDSSNYGQWMYKVYRVEAEVPPDHTFDLKKKAGYLIQPPYPLSTFIPWCPHSYYDENYYPLGHEWANNDPETWWKDYKENIYAKKANSYGDKDDRGYLYFYYPLQDNFFYDLDQDGWLDVDVGECIPFMNLYDSNKDNSLIEPPDTPPDTPHPIRYKICWPDDRDCLCPNTPVTEPCPDAEDVPELHVGETLLEPKRGLPDITNQCGVKIIFDQSLHEDVNHKKASAKLIDPLGLRAVELTIEPIIDGPELEIDGVKFKIQKNLTTGKLEFPDLPFHLRTHFSYNPYKGDFGALEFKGYFDDPKIGEPLLLLNVISERELFQLLCLDSDFEQHEYDNNDPEKVFNPSAFVPSGTYQTLIMSLYQECQNRLEDFEIERNILDCTSKYCQDKLKEEVENYDEVTIACHKALSAGFAQGTGYLTIAFSDHLCCDPNPVDLKVIKVVCPLYKGEIKVIESINVFDEKVTFRHNGDFGGNPEKLIFQWKVSGSIEKPSTPDFAPEKWNDWRLDVNKDKSDYKIYQEVCICPPVDDNICPGEDNCTDPPCKKGAYKGAVDITIEGPGIELLKDKWVTCRYTGYDTCKEDCKYDQITGLRWLWSPWTEPQLYENWIKRVVKRINLFDQRYKDFRNTEVDTFISMIKQAGGPYEGPVALVDNPEHLNKLGLIECYETLLERGKEFSIGYGVSDSNANNALLLAASRIADLYLLLGNEAFADALDCTIGFGTEDGIYGTEATSIFCFQNQLASLLEEELVLLRGRDDYGSKPEYNRLIWNYTNGQDGGEVAYSLNYYLRDQDDDGDIDEYDAEIMYPQGHGDAWGHYLTAIKGYYELLQNKYYDWRPSFENILVAGKPIEVDYYDERKFARAVAARAKCGAYIVNLTYRYNYVEDPGQQWQGYKDTVMDFITYTDSNENIELYTHRAWGVSDWASRAGQGAYLDWIVANAILPAEDTVHRGIQKIDRTTVLDIHVIPKYFEEIQSTLDNADIGLNPLGVAKDAFPFDISPTDLIQNNTTHFEQIYNRALVALSNAADVFNYINQFSQLLRRQQNNLEDFKDTIESQELSYKQRLIEIYGYPYDDDKGAGGSYPEDYDGPDIYHYMYIDSLVDKTHKITAKVWDYPKVIENVEDYDGFSDILDSGGDIKKEARNIDFHLSTRLGMLVKPESWKGRRRAPGEIQLALANVMQTKARFDQALTNYDNLMDQIEDQADLIQAQQDLNEDEIKILNTTKGDIQGLNTMIMNARTLQLFFRYAGRLANLVGNATAEGLPSVTITIGGMSVGFGMDFTAPARSGIQLAATAVAEGLNNFADLQNLAELGQQGSKEMVQSQSNIDITTIRGEFAEFSQILQLKQLVRQEASLRLELYILYENMQQAERQYLSTLARGDRIQQERLLFRQQTADQIQDYRYKDMAFRIFHNEALQKYRAQFDLAALYVYLAAKAYDYETALLDSHTLAGQAFLTDIVKHRTIGQIQDNWPMVGTGLADAMARLARNFSVLKGQLGFNNPQTETNRFSLRRELFHIPSGQDSDDAWKERLYAMKVDNLWEIPEIQRYCVPFEPIPLDEDVQPAIVIPFSTTITSGLNFFGNELFGGDNYYPPENFATKVRSVGVWFSNYNSVFGTGMAQSPRVYLVPIGMDILRTPYSRTTREWEVIDQIIPVPFRLGASAMYLDQIDDWKPKYDTLSEELFKIRRHGRFRAYHDSGALKLDEMTYDSRLIGRSVWNTKWLLIIPGASLHFDPAEGLNRFIYGSLISGRQPDPDDPAKNRTGYGVSDIKIFFQTYSYPGY